MGKILTTKNKIILKKRKLKEKNLTKYVKK